jgi:hypothetical protein
MSPAQLPLDKHRPEGGRGRRACIGFGEHLDGTEAARAFGELPVARQRGLWRSLRREVEARERVVRAEVVAG